MGQEVECLKEEKIRQAIEEHNMRIERWKKGTNHNPMYSSLHLASFLLLRLTRCSDSSALHSELLPVLKYRDGELQEVSFITGQSSAPQPTPTPVRVCLACCLLTVGLA